MEGCHIQRSLLFLVLMLLSLSVTWVTVVYSILSKTSASLGLHVPTLAPSFFFFSILLTIPSLFSWLGPPLLPNLSSRNALGLFFSIYIHLYGNNYQMQSSCYFCGMHLNIQATVTSLPGYLIGISHLIFPMCKSHSPCLTLHSKSQKMTASST